MTEEIEYPEFEDLEKDEPDFDAALEDEAEDGDDEDDEPEEDEYN